MICPRCGTNVYETPSIGTVCHVCGYGFPNRPEQNIKPYSNDNYDRLNKASCSKCGKEIEKGKKYCSFCDPYFSRDRCRNCGAEINPEHGICFECNYQNSIPHITDLGGIGR